MFIYYQQLEQLNQYHSERFPIVSLYLNVKPLRDYWAEYNSMLRNIQRTTLQEDRFSEEQGKELNQVLARIESHIRSTLTESENTRLVALFANSEGFWQEYHLPVGLPSQMAVEPTPYVRPLSVLMDEFDRYLVLVADSRKARIFSLYLNEFEEHPNVLTEDDVPDRVRVSISRTSGSGPYSVTGVGGGTGSSGVERHIQDHIHRHLKKVTDQTFAYFQQKPFNRLIIASPDDKLRSWLKNHLHSYLKRRLGAEFSAQPDTPDEQLRQLAVEAAAECEQTKEKELIDELFEKSSPQGLGVLGLDPVIEALRMGQVHTLILENDWSRPGYMCPQDHILASEPENCPLCGQDMEHVDDIVEDLIQEAIAQDAEVKHIFVQHQDFHHYQVGAILRFTLA